MDLRSVALKIIGESIKSVLPDRAVEESLEGIEIDGRIHLVAIGKAAWRMAKAAYGVLNGKIVEGIVITKYGHSRGGIDDFEIHEAGHPLPDENSLKATERVIKMVENLKENDTVLFLVSGGGSSLFEYPLEGVTLEDLMRITDELMKRGADINELNTVRKHLSAVKGGRFAKVAHPAKVIVLVLSDVIGDRLDVIASGPAYPDTTTSDDAMRILRKYGIFVPERVKKAIFQETPKELTNVEHIIIGNVEKACLTAVEVAKDLGFNPILLATSLRGEAKEVGRFVASIIEEIGKKNRPVEKPAALILGGETTVTVRGNGKGGRNQELALSVAIEIEGMEGVVFASVGTDGTDGPTNAAGGIVDGGSVERMRRAGVDPIEALANNDSYNALKASGDLIFTGPTGTNVNDLIVGLIR